MDMIEIQVQDLTGNWRTYSLTQNISALITEAMRSLKCQFPDQRERAVDGNGRLVDLMRYNVKFISKRRSSVLPNQEYGDECCCIGKTLWINEQRSFSGRVDQRREHQRQQEDRDGGLADGIKKPQSEDWAYVIRVS